MLADPYGQIELRASTGGMTTIGTGVLPAPIEVDAGAIGEASEGRLVRVAGTISASVSRSTSNDLAFSISGTDGATLKVLADASAGIDAVGPAQGRRRHVHGRVRPARDAQGRPRWLSAVAPRPRRHRRHVAAVAVPVADQETEPDAQGRLDPEAEHRAVEARRPLHPQRAAPRRAAGDGRGRPHGRDGAPRCQRPARDHRGWHGRDRALPGRSRCRDASRDAGARHRDRGEGVGRTAAPRGRDTRARLPAAHRARVADGAHGGSRVATDQAGGHGRRRASQRRSVERRAPDRGWRQGPGQRAGRERDPVNVDDRGQDGVGHRHRQAALPHGHGPAVRARPASHDGHRARQGRCRAGHGHRHWCIAHRRGRCRNVRVDRVPRSRTPPDRPPAAQRPRSTTSISGTLPPTSAAESGSVGW